MVNDTRAEYDHLQTLSDEALCALVKQGSRDAEEILVGRYHRLVRSCARPYFLAGGDSEDLLQEGMFGLIKAIREYEPGHEASLCTFAETCIRRRLYSVLRAAASGKHSPLNQAVPLDTSFFDANLSFAHVDPEGWVIDCEKTAALLENARNGCAACGSHGKITVSLRIKKGKLVIVCSNPCAPGLVIVDDMIEPKGTGIESILMAVDKYDGNIRYHLQDGIVTASLVLNC